MSLFCCADTLILLLAAGLPLQVISFQPKHNGVWLNATHPHIAYFWEASIPNFRESRYQALR
jgi:hypothetical protein